MMNGLRSFVMALLALGALVAVPIGGQSLPSPDAPRYSQDELDQLLAPIALYPDELLAQMLMAATYPLEVVQAARFLEKNPGLSREALDQALAERNWDPSVQSLAAFPQVLAMMNEQLDWTQRLGDAFLIDQARVMDTVQSLRRRAEAAGNLQSTPQQTVVATAGEIVIQPSQPDVIYVPVYDPLLIYGPWWAPAYPPWFWYPPPVYGYPVGPVFAVGIWFGYGWALSHDHWGWARPDWHHHHVALDTTHNRFWNHPGRRPPAGSTWQHSPDHRRGIAYPDPVTRDRFLPVDPSAVRAREDFRGRDLVAPAVPTAPAVPAIPAVPAAPAATVPPRTTLPSTTATTPLAPSSRPAPRTAAPTPSRPGPSAPAVQPRPSPGISPPMQQTPRVVAPSASPTFDPGISRRQVQINAQRGMESRQSIAPPATSLAPAPAMARPVAPPMGRPAGPSGTSRAPAPGGGRAPAPARPH
ncbi:MAG TPA: DUF3300 domain-containing protein [Casimicrobiaceae bacterium]|nr:DUF3300 domain-containing protein [Casimicrobiaceae bacterium]